MAAANPLLEEVGKLGQLEEVVGGAAYFRRDTGERRNRIDQLGGGVGGAARFAVVTVLVGSLTFGTGALDETVGEEQPLDRIVHLFDIAGGDMALVAQPGIDQLAELAVLFGVRRVVVVEGDPEGGEVILMFPGDSLDQGFGGNALLLGAQHDRGAVGIVGAYIVALVANALLEAHPDIGLDVFQQVAKVDRAVGVGQGTGNQNLARGADSIRHGGSGFPRKIRPELYLSWLPAASAGN